MKRSYGNTKAKAVDLIDKSLMEIADIILDLEEEKYELANELDEVREFVQDEYGRSV